MEAAYSQDFSKQVVLVTGAGRGIGFAIARRFFNSGARVALNDQTSEQVAAGLKRLASGRNIRTLGCKADVAHPGQVREMVDQILKSWGRIDLVINNAGIYPDNLVLEMSEGDWDRVMDVNAKGTFLVSKAVARHMVKAGIKGQIINISSGSYHNARVGSAHYCASKAAGIMFTKVLAMELAPFGIRVNAIAPGLIDVESMNLDQDYIDSTLRQIPRGRLGRPEDVAEAAFSLATMGTDYVTGAILAVDGGLALGRFGIPRSAQMEEVSKHQGRLV
jgi:3-oxoacyl-[acyl-carrier protein] reductase